MSRTGYLIMSNGNALDKKVGVFRDKALEDLGKRFLRLANHKKHACNLKEHKKAKFCSFAAAQIGCQSKLSRLAFLRLCLF